jgi:hypothetical protein
MIWKVCHFGMQNFGVFSSYRKPRAKDVSGESTLQPPGQARGQRRVDKTFCLTFTGTTMATRFPISFLDTQNLRDFCMHHPHR